MTHERVQRPVRVRFAPSPTGNLHIGGVRTAFFNWLFAHHYNGLFLLRIEDTDIERSKPEYTASILEAFSWLGITTPEPIVIQSSRVAEHLQIAESMVADHKAYRCFCTKEELRARLGPTASEDDGYGMYDRHCRDRSITMADIQRPHVIRFKMIADTDTITFNDLIHGPISFPMNQFDDFIIVRSDGTPTYNFVVVVDDAFMNISHVIRGDDHIANTPKQIMLYKACNYPVPEFGHVPMILGADGSRLSKRHAATAVLDYRNKGFLADALLNYLVRLGWSHGDQEVFTREELIQYFSLKNVGVKNAIFDGAKLLWMNALYLRQHSAEELMEYIVRDICPDFVSLMPQWNMEQLFALINVYKERVTTLVELIDSLVGVYRAPLLQDLPPDFSWTAETKSYVEQLAEILISQENFQRNKLEEIIKELCKKWGIKLSMIAQPLRVALTGSLTSPGVFDLLSAFGKSESIARIQHLCARLKE